MDKTKKLREMLKKLHDQDGLSWRKIAKLRKYQGIPAGTLCSIYNGDPVPDVHKRRLGIPKKPAPPAWVTEAADVLAKLEAKVPPKQNRTYNRKGKRVT
jgi:hypothetical protein